MNPRYLEYNNKPWLSEKITFGFLFWYQPTNHTKSWCSVLILRSFICKLCYILQMHLGLLFFITRPRPMVQSVGALSILKPIWPYSEILKVISSHKFIDTLSLPVLWGWPDWLDSLFNCCERLWACCRSFYSFLRPWAPMRKDLVWQSSYKPLSLLRLVFPVSPARPSQHWLSHRTHRHAN